MITSFNHKGLAELFEDSKTAKIPKPFHARIIRRLDALHQATRPGDMNIPGFAFHALNGFKPPKYTVHVNGPWCITFGFEGVDACRVDFEQYH